MKKQTGIRKGLLRIPVGLPPSFWKGTRLGYDEAGNNRDLFRHLVAVAGEIAVDRGFIKP